METLPIGTYFINFIKGPTEGFIADIQGVYILRGTAHDSYVPKEDFHKGIKDGYIVIPQGRFEIWGSCECGAQKCGTRHSDWCPLYRENFK